MLTTPLLALLTAVPVLGEAGESCRTDADCMPSLLCVASTCESRPLAPVPDVSRAVEPVAPVEALAETAPEAPRGHFTGVHFFLGATVGAGPMWSKGSAVLFDAPIEFSAIGAIAQAEARIGVLFGRFELAAELAPGSVGSLVYGVSAQQITAALSTGWMLGLYEREAFSISLPIRVRGGGFLANRGGGLLAGASVGVALRFGNAVLEARLLGGEFRARTGTNVISVPFNLSFSWIF